MSEDCHWTDWRTQITRYAVDTKPTHLFSFINKAELVFGQVLWSSVLVVIFILINFDLICWGQIVSVPAASHSVDGPASADLGIQYRYVLYVSSNIKPSKIAERILFIDFQRRTTFRYSHSIVTSRSNDTVSFRFIHLALNGTRHTYGTPTV